MTLVSPPHAVKQKVAVPDGFNFDEGTVDDKQLPALTVPENLNEYTLLLLLEKQRTVKLRELYRGNRYTAARTKRNPPRERTLPTFPPQFRCLDLSTRCILSGLKKQRLTSNSRPTNEQWITLDRVTKTFLEDAVAVLRQQCDDGTATRHSSIPYLPSLTCTTPRSSPSTTITPPSSPLILPLAVTMSEDSASPQDIDRNARSKEVAMSDSEIISLWNQVEPSVDGIDFHGYFGTNTKEEIGISF